MDGTDKWTFFYASINIDSASYFHAFEKRVLAGPESQFTKTTVTLSSASVLQEKLDERLTIYIGGTKGAASGQFVGRIAEPTFYVNYFSDQIPQNVIFQEVGIAYCLYYRFALLLNFIDIKKIQKIL